MGNTNSSQSPHTYNDYQQHPKLNSIHVTQQHHNNLTVQMMHLTKSIHNQTLLNDWRAFIIKINDSQIRQVILLPDKYSFQKHGMCTASGQLNVTFQYFPYTLTNQILNRSGLNKYLQQKQIWYLLYNLIRAANKFQRIHKKIGNIHPDNVFINSIGQVKIFAKCSLPGQKDNFELISEDMNANAYLAPQQLANDAIKGSHYPVNIDPCLAETFSIGLTVLTAGTLLQCQNLYQIHKKSLRFNQNALQSILGVFRQNYSQYLSSLLQSILRVNPNSRKSASQIYQQIYQYERKILNLQQFLPQQQHINRLRKQQYQREQINNNILHSRTKRVNIFNNNNNDNNRNIQTKHNNINNSKKLPILSRSKQKVQQLKSNHITQQTRKMTKTLYDSKQTQMLVNLNSIQTSNLNHTLSPQMTGTFSFHHPPTPTTQKVITIPPIIINTQKIISSPVIRFQSPPLQVQSSRSPPSIMPNPLYSTNSNINIRSKVSTSPIPNSKIVFQQTKILPTIRSMNSQIIKNTLPVVSHITKHQQNLQKNHPNNNQNTQNPIRQQIDKINEIGSNQNISTIKTIPLNSVIHSNNKISNKIQSKPSSTQGIFLPLESIRPIAVQEGKSSPKLTVNTVQQSEDEKTEKQSQMVITSNESQHKDKKYHHLPQIQKQQQITQKQIPLDSKIVSFQKLQ